MFTNKMSSKWIEEKFPLHWLVWINDYQELEKQLAAGQLDKEVVDPRGRTALHLSITLGHLESTRVLLRHGANANSENSRYWTAVQEAVSTGDPELLQLSLQYRDHQRHTRRTEGVPALLQKLREAPDFYVEMKWEFTSWVPLVSRMCPSDTYKVWKSGSNVRIDTTLLGFDNMNWQRGSRSYIFKGQVDEATVIEIDHDARQVYSETMKVAPAAADATLLVPSQDQVAARITAPIVTTYIDTEKISFERSKSGIWGWRNDKSETINTYECKVFSASNVELVTKTRTEHLTDQDKQKSKKTARTPLESFLGIAEQEEKTHAAALPGATSNGEIKTSANNPCSIKPEEYFDEEVDLEGRDIGRPIDQTTKTQKFKATLWLSENYPLSLQEQVIPIIDLMAATNAHFRKLKDFITLQLPAGFPVKIEIPLFHVLNARITFGNIFAGDSEAPGVNQIQGAEQDMNLCVVEDSCFDIPTGYHVMGDLRQDRLRDEDDELLQFAIQQSLLEAGSEGEQTRPRLNQSQPDPEVTLWEALNKSRPVPYSDIRCEEERLLQQALAESIQLSQGVVPPSTEGQQVLTSIDRPLPPVPRQSPRIDDDEQLRLAMEISQREQAEDQKRRKQEEEELEMILRLSMTEK